MTKKKTSKKPSSNVLKAMNGSMSGVIETLNNSKIFAGVIMILLNVGSKFINIQFSKSTEQYLKNNVTKEILVFAMAWMGTRDVLAALCLSVIFTICSDHLFNEESHICIVPHDLRVLNKELDLDKDGKITPDELSSAIAILEKAKKNYEKNKEFVEMMKNKEPSPMYST
jgi:hypothetical protein